MLCRRTGFTIVELLIVIVVIGILAAVTVVAFNGLQTRARNSARIRTAASFRKGLELLITSRGNLNGLVVGQGGSFQTGCSTQKGCQTETVMAVEIVTGTTTEQLLQVRWSYPRSRCVITSAERAGVPNNYP